MAKTPTNHGANWTNADLKELKRLAKQSTPTRVVGIKLGRTVTAVRTKASEISLSLRPTNKSRNHSHKS